MANVVGAGAVSTRWPRHVDRDLAGYLAERGEVFSSIALPESGCRAFGVLDGTHRWFVKGSAQPRAVASLERAVALHARVSHAAIIALVDHFTTPSGLALVYEWVDGEVLYPGHGGRAARQEPGSAHARFRALPVTEVLTAIDDLFDAHVAVAGAGFVAVDLYDGSMVYDFAHRRMRLCDLDEYRPGPFVLASDRLPGSTRFMAPEELVRGATIDERTTVFDLGRAALVLLDEHEVGEAFRGTSAMAAVLEHATRSDPGERYASVAALVEAWRSAVPRGAR
jgi:serine/threonine-protein kinase